MCVPMTMRCIVVFCVVLLVLVVSIMRRVGMRVVVCYECVLVCVV